MMNLSILQLKSHLIEDKRRYKDTEIRATGLRQLIQTYLDPYEDDVTQLDFEKATKALEELSSAVETLKTLSKKIKQMERELK